MYFYEPFLHWKLLHLTPGKSCVAHFVRSWVFGFALLLNQKQIALCHGFCLRINRAKPFGHAQLHLPETLYDIILGLLRMRHVLWRIKMNFNLLPIDFYLLFVKKVFSSIFIIFLFTLFCLFSQYCTLLLP